MIPRRFAPWKGWETLRTLWWLSESFDFHMLRTQALVPIGFLGQILTGPWPGPIYGYGLPMWKKCKHVQDLRKLHVMLAFSVSLKQPCIHLTRNIMKYPGVGMIIITCSMQIQFHSKFHTSRSVFGSPSSTPVLWSPQCRSGYMLPHIIFVTSCLYALPSVRHCSTTHT